MPGYGSRGKNEPIFRALINGSSLLPLLPSFPSNRLSRLGETPKIDRKIYSNISLGTSSSLWKYLNVLIHTHTHVPYYKFLKNKIKLLIY